MKAANFLHCSNSALIVAILCAAALPSCVRNANVVLVPFPIKVQEDGKPPVPLTPRNWHRVNPGMSKQDVISWVGEPSHRAYDGHFQNGNIETWFYDAYDLHDGHFDPHKIRFQNDRVIYQGFDAERLTEKQHEEALAGRALKVAQIIPPDIGFRCDDNSQCDSKKCISHKCAGPRDCTRGPGADCLSDSDCCSLKCSQGGQVCL